MDEITLKQIDETNYLDAFRLKLAPGQERFVSQPIRSLAQAYVYRNQCTPFGVYCGDKLAGYLMVLYDDEEKTYNLWHMMIDEARQHRGYGRKALERAVAYAGTKPFGPSDTLLLTCDPENGSAWALYRSLGFSETGRSDGDERELMLPI